MIESWAARPENTARRVLVTMFGDTRLPVGHDIWLAQLFRLTEVFGFSGRLVRTSMFRLAAEGWLVNERIGRESRYSLTPLAVDESLHAATRIYHSAHADWSGEWTVVLLSAADLDGETRTKLTQHLQWHGFIALARDVLAAPAADVDGAQGLGQLIEPSVHLPIGVLRFADLEALVAQGFFDQALALNDVSDAYESFVEFYTQLEASAAALTAEHAFAWRTMMIHDLRRIRLRSPDLPAELLPADWSGTAATELAANLYAELSDTASPWLSEVLDVAYPASITDRF